jgi:hypothetical protein
MSTIAHLGFLTEIDFELPKGFVDDEGTLHRRGTMRLATAADEILPLRDPRVQQNEAYLTVIVLARVVTRLGSLPDINAIVIEGLFASDLAFLERLYEQVNSGDEMNNSSVAHTNGGGALSRRVAVMGEA